MGSKLTTISISEELKKLLEKYKGDMTWDEFLEYLLHQVYKINREKYRDILAEGFKSTYKEVRVKKWTGEY